MTKCIIPHLSQIEACMIIAYLIFLFLIFVIILPIKYRKKRASRSVEPKADMAKTRGYVNDCRP